MGSQVKIAKVLTEMKTAAIVFAVLLGVLYPCTGYKYINSYCPPQVETRFWNSNGPHVMTFDELETRASELASDAEDLMQNVLIEQQVEVKMRDQEATDERINEIFEWVWDEMCNQTQHIKDIGDFAERKVKKCSKYGSDEVTKMEKLFVGAKKQIEMTKDSFSRFFESKMVLPEMYQAQKAFMDLNTASQRVLRKAGQLERSCNPSEVKPIVGLRAAPL